MKNALKILTMVPLFCLCSCGNETNMLNEAEAKRQISSMKTEIQKEDFAVPALGMSKITSVSNGQNSSFAMSLDVRFDTNVGSRYVYRKITSTNSSSPTSDEDNDSNETACCYEKEGKYFNYDKVGSDVTFYEIEEENEFNTLFDNMIALINADPKTLKNSFITALDRVSEFYTPIMESSSEEEYSNFDISYEIRFNKINESSFNFEVKGASTDSAYMLKNTETVTVFENYLPKSSYAKNTLSVNDSELVTSTSQTFTWGSVEYIYPEASN